jgi:hypothetical protein
MNGPPSPRDSPDFINVNVSNLDDARVPDFLWYQLAIRRVHRLQQETPHIRIRCNYCYSCHFKKERTEKEHWLTRGILPINERRKNQYPVIFTTYTVVNKREYKRQWVEQFRPSV